MGGRVKGGSVGGCVDGWVVGRWMWVGWYNTGRAGEGVLSTGTAAYQYNNSNSNCSYTKYKVPPRDVPRGVVQDRIEKQTACDIVLYAYDALSCHDILKYLRCSTCGSMHVSHSSTHPTNRRFR